MLSRSDLFQEINVVILLSVQVIDVEMLWSVHQQIIHQLFQCFCLAMLLTINQNCYLKPMTMTKE